SPLRRRAVPLATAARLLTLPVLVSSLLAAGPPRRCAAAPPGSQPGAVPAELQKALSTIGGPRASVFALAIRKIDPDQGNPGGTGRSVAIMQFNASSSAAFRGAAEVLLKSGGKLFLVSQARFPEVLMFDNGHRTLVRTTTDGTLVDARATV